MNFPPRILVYGGTHGNEWTGAYLIKRQASSLLGQFPQLDLEFHLANPEALKLGRRYKDEDLNRAFAHLDQIKPTFENQRAREISSYISQKPSLVIDLHTTTSSMGNTLILTKECPEIFALCQKLQISLPDLKIILAPDPNKKYLASQGELGIMIEIGAVPNNVLQGLAYENMVQILTLIFQVISRGDLHPKGELMVYEEVQDVFYPKSEDGELTAYIDKDFQTKNFIPLQGEIMPFKSFSQNLLSLNLAEELYPIFINEAAYYPQTLAFTLCKKRKISFDATC